MPNEKKSIVVTGDGPYLGYLITEGFTRVEDAVWYDKSRQASAAIETEKKLVEAGFVKPTALKAKGAKSGGNANACDILVVVKKDKVEVKRTKGKSITVRLKKVEKMADLEAGGKAFVAAVKKLMK